MKVKKLFAGVICTLFVLMFNSLAQAADRGSPEEAIALVKRAAAYLKANGKEKAFEEFSNPNGKFKDRDLYIFVLDTSGKMLAHGGNARLIGKNLIDVKDMDGKQFTKMALDLAAAKGKGWTDYKWVNPVTSAIENKSSYVESVGDVVVGCGIYKQ